MRQPLLMVFVTVLFLFVGAGVEFDGTNDVIITSTNELLLENGPCTISVWINIIADVEDETFIFQQRATGSGTGVTLRVRDGLIGLRFVVSGSTSLIRNTNIALTENTWYHVLVTWDGSTTASNSHIYVNAIEQTYSTTQNGVSLFNTAGLPVLIGDNELGNRSFNGIISELAIWRAVLTPTEIALLAKSRVKGMPLQIQPANLKAYWPLDEFADGATASGAGSIKDLSGNGNHGTPSNGPLGRPESVLSRSW